MTYKRLAIRFIKPGQADMYKPISRIDDALAEMYAALLDYPFVNLIDIGLFRESIRRLPFQMLAGRGTSYLSVYLEAAISAIDRIFAELVTDRLKNKDRQEQEKGPILFTRYIC